MKIINTPNAPQAIGPYSQGVEANQIIFLSGQIPLNPQTMELVGNDIEAQTTQVFENIKAVLAAAKLSLGSVVKTTVFLKNMGDFNGMNRVYARYFADHKPARSTIEVARLPKDSLVEIECLAMASKKAKHIIL
ncbi:MAG: RidA family protein [Kiritimatiellae bacterium]|nr:RidA family protein [Kiritimatiellia bacterium]